MTGSGLRRKAAFAALSLLAAATSGAAPIVSVDMDPATPGIQTEVTVTPASAFEIDVVVEGVAEPDVLMGYAFELIFDTALLELGEVRDAGFIRPDFLPDSLFTFSVIPAPTGFHVLALIPASLGLGGVGDGAILHVGLEALDLGEALVELGVVELYRPHPRIGSLPIPLGGIHGGAVTIVPEPASAVLLGLGCAALARSRRRATPRA